MQTNAQGDPFRTLALRLLAARYWGPGGRTYEALDDLEILPGQLPPDLPFELPVPALSFIVGSFVRPRLAIVVIDVFQPAQEVLDFYCEVLTSQGWSIHHFGDTLGGFLNVRRAAHSRTTFYSRRAARLSAA